MHNNLLNLTDPLWFTLPIKENLLSFVLAGTNIQILNKCFLGLNAPNGYKLAA